MDMNTEVLDKKLNVNVEAVVFILPT